MMSAAYNILLTIMDEDLGAAGVSAQALIDIARETEGVVRIERQKAVQETMDIGTVVEIVFTSGATLAVAQGMAAWLRARRGARVVIEKSSGLESIKTTVEGIDPATAQRIVERHI